MNRLTNALGRVRVAAPCEEDWGEMRGDERVRFCARCSLNVYNLSAMTRREAERLVVEREGRLCVRFYRRKDGTILTRNCPTGLAKLKRRVSRAASATAAAAISFIAGVGVAPATKQSESYAADAVAVSIANDAAAAPPSYISEDELHGDGYSVAFGAYYDSSGPFDVLAPLGFVSAIFTLLTWPLFLFRDRNEEERREALRIWSGDWVRSDESAKLPREGFTALKTKGD